MPDLQIREQDVPALKDWIKMLEVYTIEVEAESFDDACSKAYGLEWQQVSIEVGEIQLAKNLDTGDQREYIG